MATAIAQRHEFGTIETNIPARLARASPLLVHRSCRDLLGTALALSLAELARLYVLVLTSALGSLLDTPRGHRITSTVRWADSRVRLLAPATVAR